MVLLTSSAISVFISSTVVCIFTFLLFLSGYVLQQQTVRSLQEALRQPPPPRPTPTLPAAFQTVAQPDDILHNFAAIDTAVAIVDVNNVPVAEDIGRPEIYEDGRGVVADPPNLERDEQQLRLDRDRLFIIAVNDPPSEVPRAPSVQADSGAKHPEAEDIYFEGASPPPLSPSTAYIFSLLEPAYVCSALLFARHHAKYSKIPLDSRPSIIFLYPSTWETRPDTSSVAALGLLRSSVDSTTKEFGVLILHPVPINVVWSGPGMLEGQVLAELQRGRFTYERMIYLRLPGLAVDIPGLDIALSTSDLRRSWSPLSSTMSATGLSLGSSSLAPPLLLVSPTRGLLVPRANLRHLTASVSTEHANHHENEMDVEAKAASKGAAWILFDEAELEHRRGEKEWYGGVVERFERGRREVCLGSGLLGK